MSSINMSMDAILDDIPRLVEQGKAVCIRGVKEEWEREVKSIEGVSNEDLAAYRFNILNVSLKIMKSLEANRTKKFVADLLGERAGSSPTLREAVCDCVLRYAPRGIEFYKYNSAEYQKRTKRSREKIEEIRARNVEKFNFRDEKSNNLVRNVVHQ